MYTRRKRCLPIFHSTSTTSRPSERATRSAAARIFSKFTQRLPGLGRSDAPTNRQQQKSGLAPTLFVRPVSERKESIFREQGKSKIRSGIWAKRPLAGEKRSLYIETFRKSFEVTLLSSTLYLLRRKLQSTGQMTRTTKLLCGGLALAGVFLLGSYLLRPMKVIWPVSRLVRLGQQVLWLLKRFPLLS